MTSPLTIRPAVAHEDPDYVSRIRTVKRFLAHVRHGDDQLIADLASRELGDDDGRWSRVQPGQVAHMRFLANGAMPKVDHTRTIWILAAYARTYGLADAAEQTLHLDNGGRLRPDLLIAAPPTWHVALVIEVKSVLANRTHVRLAAEQALRYVEAIGGGEPIVTTYARPPVDEYAGVTFLSASAVRARLRQLAAESGALEKVA